MKAYVITILENERSVQAAERCIKSGARFGTTIEKWKAITPADGPKSIMKEKDLPYENFNEIYSRQENCAAAFLSHYSLWEESIKTNEDILVLEHDAVFMSEIPSLNGYDGCISLGEPSYGKYKTPRYLGIQELQSKNYFPGAHAYVISPRAAEVIIKKAKEEAGPTDIFLHKDRFRFLQEYYPWPIKAQDSFTTIQKDRGCHAKHRWDESYEII